MLNLTPPNYKYCPFCGQPLSEKTQDGKVRKYCPKDNWTYYPHVVSSASAIIIKNHKVVMVKRNIQPYKGTWMFPSGFLDFGEHPKEAAMREAQEETGLQAKSAKFYDILQAIDDPREPGHNLFIYLVEVENTDLKVDGTENTEARWVSLDDNPKIGWQIHRQLFQKLQQSHH